MFSHVLNTSRDVDSATFLSSPLQCLTTLPLCELFLFPCTVQYEGKWECFPWAESVAVQCCGIPLSREHQEWSRAKTASQCVTSWMHEILDEKKSEGTTFILLFWILFKRLSLLQNVYRSNVHTSPLQQAEFWAFLQRKQWHLSLGEDQGSFNARFSSFPRGQLKGTKQYSTVGTILNCLSFLVYLSRKCIHLGCN